MNEREPVYFKVFLDYLDAIEPLSDTERGRLFTALLKYAKTGEAPQLSGNERFLFPMMKAQMDRDFVAWRAKNKEIHEIRAEAGRKGGNARASKAKQAQANEANASKAKQIKHKTTDYGLLTTDEDEYPPNPPAGGTGDAPGEPAPVPDKPSRRERTPSTPDDLTPDEEAMLLAVSASLAEAARDWLRYKAERREPYKPVGRRTLLNRIVDNAQQYGAEAMIRVIRDSISSNYKGIVWDRLSQSPRGGGGQPRKTWAELLEEMQREGTV